MNKKSTREKVLQMLLNHPRSTIPEIAGVVGINNISVRHHLTSLQAENLVSFEEERHGVGRPRMVYFLTDNGREKFPTNYMRLAIRMLTQMKNSLPAATVDNFFDSIAANMTMEYQDQAKNLTLEEKLNLITRVLQDEGFTAEWEKMGNEYIIRENTCPYYHVSVDHPEICAIGKKMISNILSVPVEKVDCVLGGNNYCTYVVKHNETIEEA